MAVLARVTTDTEALRGPDVIFSVEVPGEWLLEGACVEIRLPRLLSCARCEGGGCDACERRGAFERERWDVPPTAVVPLPQASADGPLPVQIRLRLPDAGAADRDDPGRARGHLLLSVNARPLGQGYEPAPHVSRLSLVAPGGEGPETARRAEQRAMVWLGIWTALLAMLIVVSFWLWN